MVTYYTRIDDAVSTVKNYVCARCWGPLVAHADKSDNWVVCANPDCNGAGFVTRSYADRQKANDHMNYVEAKHNLEAILPQEPKKSAAEILAALGF